jgi:hypothetical protein
MHVRAVLLPVMLAATSSMIACSGKSDRVTAPTQVETPDAIGSSASPVDRVPVPPSPPLPPVSDSCDAVKAQFAIGQRASSDLLERARVAAQAGSARFLRPNERITLEFLGSRLNLILNDRDVVHSATCG